MAWLDDANRDRAPASAAGGLAGIFLPGTGSVTLLRAMFDRPDGVEAFLRRHPRDLPDAVAVALDPSPLGQLPNRLRDDARVERLALVLDVQEGLGRIAEREQCPGGIVPAGPRRADHLAVEQRIEPLDVEAGALDVRPELQIDKGRF
jgi:hypothetical protein